MEPKLISDGFFQTSCGFRIFKRDVGPREGTAVVLVAGWPQTLHAWRHVQQRLAAAGIRSIALDPPGLGESDVFSDPACYATPTVAAVMAEALALAGIESYALVGHDVGAWIAYAWAVTRPESLSKVVLVDAAIPGAMAEGMFTLERATKQFQFFFNAVPGLPEKLTQGRERVYLEWLFANKTAVADAITSEDIDVYMRCFAQEQRMSAGFDYYRLAASSAKSLSQAPPLTMPVLTLGAEFGVGNAIAMMMRARSIALEAHVISGSGHFIPEEAPMELTDHIIAFRSREDAL